MHAACQAWYQEIINLFNHANLMAEITSTISKFSIAYLRFVSTPLPSPCTFSYGLRVPRPPFSECTYFLNDPYWNVCLRLQNRRLSSRNSYIRGEGDLAGFVWEKLCEGT